MWPSTRPRTIRDSPFPSPLAPIQTRTSCVQFTTHLLLGGSTQQYEHHSIVLVLLPPATWWFVFTSVRVSCLIVCLFTPPPPLAILSSPHLEGPTEPVPSRTNGPRIARTRERKRERERKRGREARDDILPIIGRTAPRGAPPWRRPARPTAPPSPPRSSRP